MSLDNSRVFWDAKAAENPYWYVSSYGPYDERNLAEFWQAGHRIWLDLRDAIGYLPTRRDVVIEIGCGVGRLTRAIAADVGHVHAFDISEGMLQVARRSGLSNATFRHGEGDSLAGVPSGAADLAIAYCVFQHLPSVAVLKRYLGEMTRVVKPGGRIVIMESQTLPAMFLPGHPSLERRIQEAESERSREEAGARTFQERRQRTLEALREANLADVAQETHLLQCRAPLTAAARAYIETVVFGRNWGERLRPLLSSEDWARRAALCDPQSAEYVLARPDYYCLYPITVFTARNRA